MFESTITILLLWLSITLLVMALAMNKNRSPFWWGLLTLMAPPLSLMLITLMGKYEPSLGSPEDRASHSAYRASLAAGNHPSIAIRDGGAARKRYNSQNHIRKRYNSDELEQSGPKKNTHFSRWG